MTFTVFPLEERKTILVTGKDRTSWLNGMVTCDVTKVAPGKAAYGFLVEKKGRIQTDFFLVAAEGRIALAVPAKLRDAVLATLDHHLIMEDAELTTPDTPWFYASGSGALELTGELDLFGEGGGLLDAYTGPLGDPEQLNALYIERGWPRFGVEFDETFYPQEANLEKVGVSFDKGCYLGQEVVYMLENRGHVKKKLVPLDLAELVPPGTPLTTPAGDAVGAVKSSVIGPLRGKPVAIASVKWAQAKAGTELRAGTTTATVRAFP